MSCVTVNVKYVCSSILRSCFTHSLSFFWKHCLHKIIFTYVRDDAVAVLCVIGCSCFSLNCDKYASSQHDLWMKQEHSRHNRISLSALSAWSSLYSCPSTFNIPSAKMRQLHCGQIWPFSCNVSHALHINVSALITHGTSFLYTPRT